MNEVIAAVAGRSLDYPHKSMGVSAKAWRTRSDPCGCGAHRPDWIDAVANLAAHRPGPLLTIR